jgi:hypothetical protein
VIWTTAKDLRGQLQKRWDRGDFLSCIVDGYTVFPMRLKLKSPSSQDMVNSLIAVQGWTKALKGLTDYRIEWRSFRHQTMGEQQVPCEVWVDTLSAALRIVGKSRDHARFEALCAQTSKCQPLLLPWLGRRPMLALSLADKWNYLLSIVGWLQRRKRPGVYLRQVDVEGVHSKFIEGHKAVLTELLDITLPADSIDDNYSGAGGFAKRYGFLDKPMRVRFRALDHALALTPGGSNDVTLDHASFESLKLLPKRVFITENEINFLSFPPLEDAIVVFGAGHGLEFGKTSWLQQCDVYYWGDLDTHGFAILDELRKWLPQTNSLLMDKKTLLRFKSHWCHEGSPSKASLARLLPAEAALYQELQSNALGVGVRLEQERIGFEWVMAGLCEAAQSRSALPA